MKTLHILKTTPDDDTTNALMSMLVNSEGEESTIFRLYEEPANYEELLDLIFEHDKVISWW